MKQQNILPKVAVDIFYEQFKWALWFFGIFTAVHVIVLFFSRYFQFEIGGYFEYSIHSTAIFMLVCGILAAYVFLSAYVQQGVTRKNVYRGIALGAFALAVAITLITLLLNGIEYFLAVYTPLPFIYTSYGTIVDWLMESLFYFLNVFTCYLIGWLISIGYYRYGWITGFLFIAFAIIALSLNENFLGEGELISLILWLPFSLPDTNLPFGFLGSLLLIAALLISARLLTKRIVIKM